MDVALKIIEVVDLIISGLHNEYCSRCRKISSGAGIEITGGSIDTNRKPLFNFIMVSKLWASIAIPKLWSEHADLYDLWLTLLPPEINAGSRQLSPALLAAIPVSSRLFHRWCYIHFSARHHHLEEKGQNFTHSS